MTPLILLFCLLGACLALHYDDVDLVAGRFIVEFNNPSALAKRSASGSDPHEAFHDTLKQAGLAASPLYNFSSVIFNGASFAVSNTGPGTLKHIRSLPEVSQVWQAQYFLVLEEDPVIADEPPALSPHTLTGVDKLHARGYSGAGIAIGVIDTGVDYLHPALGQGFGPDYKVAGGFNFVGNSSYNITNRMPDDDPMDCQGHGTHVAGIIAGNDSNLLGVAPNATLFSYKIFGCGGGTTEDVLMSALQLAFEDGVDIITASVGLGGQGFLMGPANLMASRLVEAGVFVSIAAGNNGEEGPRYPSSPGSGQFVTTVASAESDMIVTWIATAQSTSGENFTFQYITTLGVAPNVTGKFDVTMLLDGLNCSQAEDLPASINNNTALLLPSSSRCIGRKLYTSVKDLGYPVVLNYLTLNSSAFSYSSPTASVEGLPIDIFGTAEFDFGMWAVNQTKLGHNFTLEFDSSKPLVMMSSQAATAGHMNSFSSWGPHYEDGLFYPAVTAPGGNIFSSWMNGRYSILSGSSMATPYIAGVAALYLESLTNISNTTNYALELRRKLITTAEALQLYTGGVDSPFDLAPLIQQGGGFVNATSVIDLKSRIVSEPSMNLGASSDLATNFSIALRNDNSGPVTYFLSHSPSVTIISKSKSNKLFKYFPPYSHVYLEPNYKTNVTVKAGEMVEIPVKFTIPDSLSSDLAPIFQGKVVITGSNGEVLGVPYVGTLMDDFEMWQSQNEPKVYGVENDRLFEITESDNIVNVSLSEVPQVMFSNQAGASYLTFGLVEPSFTLKNNFTAPLVPGQNGFIQHLYGDGVSYMFPMPFVGRSEDDVAIPLNLLSNGSAISSGRYRVIGAMLPAPYVPDNSTDHWVTYLSDPFDYVVAKNEEGVLPKKASGVNAIFGEVSLVSAVTSTSELGSPYDPVQLMITLGYKKNITKGSVAEITLPAELTSLPDWYYGWDSRYMDIANITISQASNSKDSVLKMTFLEDVNSTDISGTINLLCKLNNPDSYTKPGRYFFNFDVEGIPSLAFLNIKGIDQTLPTVHSNRVDKKGLRWLDIDIPSGFGNWSTVNMSASLTGSDLTFDNTAANQFQLVESTELDSLSNISKSTNQTSVTYEVASLKSTVMTYLERTSFSSSSNGKVLRASFPISGQVETGQEYRISVTLRAVFNSSSVSDLIFNLNTIVDSTPGLAGTSAVTFKIVYTDELDSYRYINIGDESSDSIDKDAYRYIDKDAYRYINKDAYRYINKDAYRYINKDAYRYINKDAYRYINKDAYRYINKDAYRYINKDAYRYINKDAYRYINKDAYRYINKDAYRYINKDAYRYINKDGYRYINKDGYRYINKDGYRYINKDAYRYINKDAYRYINKDAYRYINKDAYRYINEEAYRRMDSDAYRYLDTSAYRYLDTSAYRYLDTSAYRYLDENAYRYSSDAYRYAKMGLNAYRRMALNGYRRMDLNGFTRMSENRVQRMESNAFRYLSSNAYRYINKDAYRYINSDAYRYINSDAYRYINSDAYRYINSDAYRYINSEAYRYLDSSAYRYLGAEAYRRMATDAYRYSGTTAYRYSSDAYRYSSDAYRYADTSRFVGSSGYRRSEASS